MQVRDLIRFNRENYYNGAVQAEWYYDNDKVEGIAKSYVFHGPKYYGVLEKDVITGEHRLLDTVSFAKKIADKLVSQKVENNLALTIAGYGTGKSHLAVTLGALFSGREKLKESVLANIESVDSQIVADIRVKVEKRNLIIALNGMRNFNLDAEILNIVRIVLAQNGISDKVLKSMTKTYDVAKYFIDTNFDNCVKEFDAAAKLLGVVETGLVLKKYLLDNIEHDAKAIDIVNTVFKRVTGDFLHWESGISAGDVLLKVSRELCGDGKPFNKILILFDEFGRYIEYVAANPAIAGDASLQQIFEAVQNASGTIIFVGFIQYELEAYLSHIDKASNVIRYVGRYSSSEKYYLSSNFETILANLLEKNSHDAYEKTVGHALSRFENFHNKIHSAMKRWSGLKMQKTVWTSEVLYKSVILRGCYPLHPITVWLLSNSTGWMQQRSTIAFCAEMFDHVSQKEIVGDWLPYIYPVDIIDSSIYAEMLNSEEKGLVKSQNCMLYNEICLKIGDKMTLDERTILKAVLITRIAEFRFYDKEDAYLAFRYCTNLKEEEIKSAVRNLEDQHGVISFDDQAKTYDLIAEANGFNEFRRVFSRYRTGLSANIEDMDEDILSELELNNPIETAFAQKNHISSSEWKFEKRLVSSESINVSYMEAVLRTVNSANDGEACRGIIIYAYCCENSESEIVRLGQLYQSLSLETAPVEILFLDDPDRDIIQALTAKNIMLRFSSVDSERFSRHIIAQKRNQNKKIISKFNALVRERKKVSNQGITVYEGRLNLLCTERFSSVYTMAVPFVFDGFENAKSTQARKTFITLCIKMFDHTLMNIQSYQALNTADKNRVQSCIAVGTSYSWQIFNNSCQLILPQNELIKQIYCDVDASIPEEESFSVFRLLGKYLRAPYGMNIYSYTLFVIYFIQKQENKIICYLGDEKLTAGNFSNRVLKDGKLKFSELQRITIQRNHNVNIDSVIEVCHEVLENTDVYKCKSLSKKLVDIVREEGSNTQNEGLIGSAEMRLHDGERIREELDKKKDKIKQYLNDALTKLVIHKFIGIFDYLQDVHGTIKEGLPYTYSQEFISFIDDSMQQTKNYLGVPFDMALKILKCTNITQLSNFEKSYARVSKVLREQGYNLQADAVDLRVEQIVEETKKRNQYNQAIGECEKDIALYSNTSALLYGECDSVISKFEGWKKFFKDVDMPAIIASPLVSKIEKIFAGVNERKQSILTEIERKEKSIYLADKFEDMCSVRSDLENLLEHRLPEDIEGRLAVVIKQINLLEVRINKLPNTIDEIQEIIACTNCVDSYDNVYIIEAKNILHNLVSAQAQWIDKVILPVENEQEMDAQQCTNWIEKLHNIPDSFSLEVRKRAQEAECIVTSKLHACRVHGVLSLYNSLTNDEKDEFKRIILRE